jgi:hypothetical protein
VKPLNRAEPQTPERTLAVQATAPRHRHFTPAIEVGLCQCGCGERTEIAKATDRRHGYIKGQPRPFRKAHHSRAAPQPYVVDSETGCWIWQWTRAKGGYGKITRDGRTWIAHVWFWMQRHGPVPEGLELDHLCRNPPCVNPDHLEPVTPLENMRRCRATRLTLADVAAIRASDEPHRVLAERFGVSPSNIRHIRRRESWKAAT